MSKILAPALGTLLALAPSVASAATHKQLDLLSAQTLSEVIFVVNNPMIAEQCNPKWEQAALSHGFDVYRDATTRCYAWEGTYKFADLNKELGVIMRPEGDDDPNACVASPTYIDEFTRNNQRYLVVDSEDVKANLVCPPVAGTELPATITPIEKITSSDVPTVGSFTELDSQIMDDAVFLKPLSLGLDEAQVDAKLDKPANLLHRSRLGVDVYAKYETVKYDTGTGRLVVRLDSGKKEDECTTAITYTDSFIQDGQRYFVVTSDFKANPKECLESNPVSTDVSVEQAAVVATSVTESKPWQVKVFAGVGANEEELGSEYSLGAAGYGALGAQLRFPESRFCVGLNGDAIVSGTGSGFEGGVATVGYCDDRFDIAFQGGVSGEPRAPDTALNGAPTLGILAHADVLELGPWAINAGASARMDLYGGGAFPANVTAFLGASYNIQIGGSGSPSTPNVAKYHLVTSTKPYSYELPVTGPEDKTKAAEAIRLYEEMLTKAKNNKWDGVEAYYLSALELGIPLSYKTHMYGAEAARGLGDMRKSYERLLIAQSLASTDEERQKAGDWINDLETNYASVIMIVDVRGAPVFQAVTPPFAPDHRAAIAMAQAELAKDGSFEGFIPNIPFTFGGETVEALVPVSEDLTTEIHLEK